MRPSDTATALAMGRLASIVWMRRALKMVSGGRERLAGVDIEANRDGWSDRQIPVKKCRRISHS
jgi:hypothetical protein